MRLTVATEASLLLYTLINTVTVASQECTAGDLRTVRGADPDDGRGYLQYCYNGEWRSLCAGGGTWSRSSARVACRQLGYSAFIAQGSGCPGQVTEETVRLAAGCSGTEDRIQGCGDGVIEYNCSCNAQAWLACLQDCIDGDIRLVGNSTNEGRMEVCVDGHWGTVCNNSQEEIAGAVCSQLGFLSEGATSRNLSAVVPMPISSCSVENGGSLNCSLITDASCDHSMDLGVVCRTYEQLYNELLETTPQDSASTGGVTTIITALGVVSGVLVVLLLGILTALVVTCQKRRHRGGSTNNPGDDKTSQNQQYDVPITNLANNPAYVITNLANNPAYVITNLANNPAYVITNLAKNPAYVTVQHQST